MGRVAVVTGASAGIGAAIASDLTKAGMIVIGLARRSERIEELWTSLKAENSNITGKLYAFKCDLTEESNIKAAFEWIDEKFGRVDVLINNAGVFMQGNIIDADNSSKLRQVINLDVLGTAFCTREAFQLMQKYQINDGHVVIINSVCGHYVPYDFVKQGISLNISPSCKYALTAMTEVLRQEFQLFKTKTKITVSVRGYLLYSTYSYTLNCCHIIVFSFKHRV